jgi:hypothetical protein
MRSMMQNGLPSRPHIGQQVFRLRSANRDGGRPDVAVPSPSPEKECPPGSMGMAIISFTDFRDFFFLTVIPPDSQKNTRQESLSGATGPQSALRLPLPSAKLLVSNGHFFTLTKGVQWRTTESWKPSSRLPAI